MKTTKIVSLCLCAAMLISCLTSCTPKKETESTIPKDELGKLLESAYVYALPLVITDAVATKMTNTAYPTNTQAPANQFIHEDTLADFQTKDALCLDVDTVCSQLVMDLSLDALVVEIPKCDRYCNIELVDAYTNCTKIIDAAKFNNPVEKFVFTSPDYKIKLPAGMTEVNCSTSLNKLLVRIVCNGTDDVQNISAIQGQMKSYTLAQYNLGIENDVLKGSYDAKNNFDPLQHVMDMTMEEFFGTANELMLKNPPAPEDGEILQKIAKINVGPGLRFDASLFGKSAGNMWKFVVSNIEKNTEEKSRKYIKTNGVWSYMGEPVAEFGTEYYYRAFAAIENFNQSPVKSTVTLKATADMNGEILSGNKEYVLHFDNNDLPKVEDFGFWSVTAYDSKNDALIANELDRYCFNDRSPYVFNQDGSLDIYIQNKAPAGGIENWLPVSDGEFYLILRVYNPDQTVIANQWDSPTIKCQIEEKEIEE